MYKIILLSLFGIIYFDFKSIIFEYNSSTGVIIPIISLGIIKLIPKLTLHVLCGGMVIFILLDKFINLLSMHVGTECFSSVL
ncbi:hypothetical protein AMV108 [Betaentomopoxvirus amoorei]|uniref:AMV108 n=1 Tax=Amsacta moorei entomopoxvirus TaxID=28321 RepID=Q9EMU1_AMEPV|nr:hypothetical protein AMV108 [Amsacta moorei entomopoxvirus]AAG02814.1 AMV108 [Amsacta moorei entomopoxvirus]